MQMHVANYRLELASIPREKVYVSHALLYPQDLSLCTKVVDFSTEDEPVFSITLFKMLKCCVEYSHRNTLAM